MRVLLALPVLVLLAGCGSSSSGASSSSKDLGCMVELGYAESDFNDVVKGSNDGTATSGDESKKIGTVASHLNTLAEVNPVPEIKTAATAGALKAGRLRVEIVNGGTFASSSEVDGLRTDLNTLDKACTAAGKS